MDAFQPFSLTHAFALIAIAALTWLFVGLERRHSNALPTPPERALAIINLVIWAAAHTWWIIPPRLDLATTLPLQLCHLSSVIASLVLLTRLRVARALLYFWGIGLSTQALLTPNLTEPPDSLWFWAFWAQHGFIVMVAARDLVVYRFRPGWRDYGIACGAALAYLAVVLPINLMLGANYGFVGDSKPGQPSIVDVLGPWPERILIIVALVAAVMALLMLPWQIARWRGRRASASQ